MHSRFACAECARPRPGWGGEGGREGRGERPGPGTARKLKQGLKFEIHARYLAPKGVFANTPGRHARMDVVSRKPRPHGTAAGPFPRCGGLAGVWQVAPRGPSPKCEAGGGLAAGNALEAPRRYLGDLARGPAPREGDAARREASGKGGLEGFRAPPRHARTRRTGRRQKRPPAGVDVTRADELAAESPKRPRAAAAVTPPASIVAIPSSVGGMS